MSATNLDTFADQRSQLQAAFLAFGSVSEQLSGAFDALRSQVAQLQSDLGEARAAKQNLAARMSALVEGLPGGVLVLDLEGNILEANPAAHEMLGESLVGQSFTAACLHAGVREGAQADMLETVGGRFINVSRRALGHGGEAVLITDVTESHTMQLFLARQQRLLTLGELAAGLAHQVRTPLATALLYASQMTLTVRKPDELARCAEKTVSSLKLLDRLVNDMLAFAHGGAARERVSVSAVLEQVAQWLRPALRRGVQLTIRTEAPNLAVRANAPSLVSAVLNLATNALQAAPGDLRLELLARSADGGRAQILVSDDGPGIPERIRQRIFEPFFTTRAAGNGIGLAIVKSVIEAHHGSIQLLEGGAGATFVIDLPAEEAA